MQYDPEWKRNLESLLKQTEANLEARRPFVVPPSPARHSRTSTTRQQHNISAVYRNSMNPLLRTSTPSQDYLLSQKVYQDHSSHEIENTPPNPTSNHHSDDYNNNKDGNNINSTNNKHTSSSLAYSLTQFSKTSQQMNEMLQDYAYLKEETEQIKRDVAAVAVENSEIKNDLSHNNTSIQSMLEELRTEMKLLDSNREQQTKRISEDCSHVTDEWSKKMNKEMKTTKKEVTELMSRESDFLRKEMKVMREEIREELSRWIRDEIKNVKDEIIFNLKKQLTEQVKESQVEVIDSMHKDLKLLKSDMTDTIRHELTEMINDKADSVSEKNKKELKVVKEEIKSTKDDLSKLKDAHKVDIDEINSVVRNSNNTFKVEVEVVKKDVERWISVVQQNIVTRSNNSNVSEHTGAMEHINSSVKALTAQTDLLKTEMDLLRSQYDKWHTQTQQHFEHLQSFVHASQGDTKVEVEVLKKDIESAKKENERLNSLTQSLTLSQQQQHHQQQYNNHNSNDAGNGVEQRLKQQLQDIEKNFTTLSADHKVLKDTVTHRAADVANEVDTLRKEISENRNQWFPFFNNIVTEAKQQKDDWERNMQREHHQQQQQLLDTRMHLDLLKREFDSVKYQVEKIHEDTTFNQRGEREDLEKIRLLMQKIKQKHRSDMQRLDQIQAQISQMSTMGWSVGPGPALQSSFVASTNVEKNINSQSPIFPARSPKTRTSESFSDQSDDEEEYYDQLDSRISALFGIKRDLFKTEEKLRKQIISIMDNNDASGSNYNYNSNNSNNNNNNSKNNASNNGKAKDSQVVPSLNLGAQPTSTLTTPTTTSVTTATTPSTTSTAKTAALTTPKSSPNVFKIPAPLPKKAEPLVSTTLSTTTSTNAKLAPTTTATTATTATTTTTSVPEKSGISKLISKFNFGNNDKPQESKEKTAQPTSTTQSPTTPRSTFITPKVENSSSSATTTTTSTSTPSPSPVTSARSTAIPTIAATIATSTPSTPSPSPSPQSSPNPSRRLSVSQLMRFNADDIDVVGDYNNWDEDFDMEKPKNVQQGTASPAEEKDEEVDVGEEEQLSMDTGYHDVSYQNNNEEQIEEEEDFVDVDDSVPAATPRMNINDLLQENSILEDEIEIVTPRPKTNIVLSQTKPSSSSEWDSDGDSDDDTLVSNVMKFMK